VAVVRKPHKRKPASDGSADDKGDLVDASEPSAPSSPGTAELLVRAVALATPRLSSLWRAGTPCRSSSRSARRPIDPLDVDDRGRLFDCARGIAVD